MKYIHVDYVGRSGPLENSMPFIRRVAGSNTTLASTQRPWANPSLAVACGASA